MEHIPTTATAVQKLKRLAKYRRKSIGESLAAALDTVARESGYSSWKHVTVIAGGESGPGSRPMEPQWPENLREQCNAAGVAFHFKQWGHWAPIEQAANALTARTAIHIVRRDGSEVRLAAVGKGKAGRSLGGRHWDQFPSPSKPA